MYDIQLFSCCAVSLFGTLNWKFSKWRRLITISLIFCKCVFGSGPLVGKKTCANDEIYLHIYPCCVAQDVHWNSIGLHLSINRLLCASIKYHWSAPCVYIEYYCACVSEGFTQGGRLQLADAAPWGNFWFALIARKYASLVLLWVKKSFQN